MGIPTAQKMSTPAYASAPAMLAGYPMPEEPVTRKKSRHKHKAKGVEDCVDESQLRFVSGWCCGFTGLMLEDCLGCSGESQFCCLTERCCCKAGQKPLGCEAPKGEICQLGCGIISCGCKNCMGSSDKAGCSCIQS